MESEKESNFSLTREMRRQRLRMTKNPQLIKILKKNNVKQFSRKPYCNFLEYTDYLSTLK